MNRNNILFVHIPKTAGTSFRHSAKKFFGDENTYFDYNISSSETSEIIKKYVYEKNDFYALSLNLFQKENIFLSGHFHASKYSGLFDTLDVITFVRNPIEQVISHYKHFITYSNYKESIEVFVKENRFKNIQSKILANRPLELYGFIGLTEEYAKSLELINKDFNMELEVLKLNSSIKDKYFDDEIINLIIKENQEDIKLYEKAKTIFKNYLQCFEKELPYTYAHIQEKSKKRIRGIAFQRNNKEAIELEIYENNKLISTVTASAYRPGIAYYCSTRKSFVGFDYIFEKEISEKSNIHVFVKETGQEIY